MRKLLTIVALLTAMTAQAQWRVGVVGGADYNVYRMDQQYMTDFKVDGRWGATLGVTGQYDVNEWLGVRAELDWTQKNYRRSRVVYSDIDYKLTNNYLQLPLMASFSFGAERLRGFCNVGVYGGYWLNSYRKGSDFNSISRTTYLFSQKVDFEKDQDQRWDCGFVGGLGLEYRISKRLGAQVEARYYYSTTSFRKDQPHFKDKRYHSTVGLQAGVMYYF